MVVLWPSVRGALGHAAAFSVFTNLMLLAPTVYMLQVFDRVLTSQSIPTLLMLSIGVAIALVAMSVVDAARSRLLIQLGRRVDERLSPSVLKHVVAYASAPVLVAPPTGLKDVATLKAFFSGASVIALFDAPWMLVYVAVIFAFHPVMGAAASAGALVLVVLALATERANRRAVQQLSGVQRRSGSLIEHALRQADVLTSLGMTEAIARHWRAMNQHAMDLMESGNRRAGALLAASKFLRQAVQVMMMGLGAWLVVSSHLTPGVMMAATILFGRAMAPVEALIGNWSNLINARLAYQRLRNAGLQLDDAQQPTQLPPPSGRIGAEAVCLQFSNAPDRKVLDLVSFELPPGRSLGVLGASGAGKSSLLKVLVGAWQPTTGRVTIDGGDLVQRPSETLGPYIGYLSQTLELLPGTVADNIARFQTRADDDVVQASRLANALEMIMKLPKGFDTMLGEGGVRLSGGQAQRVGLARALFRSPRIVVLDEPDANLDAEGERALFRTLEELKRGNVTVIVASHKPALIGRLDYLLVLDAGKVALSGPRDDVLRALAGTNKPPTPAVTT